MFAALRGRYVQFVVFMGMSERYPRWFQTEISDRIYINESRYCFWTPPPERECDYYEKELIESYSVMVRKSDGETHVMEVDTFSQLYNIFQYNSALNSGRAAFVEDCIEYVECAIGSTLNRYPNWFYEYFTESLNHPDGQETYLFTLDGDGCIVVDEHCVFLRNRFNEVRHMSYFDFLKHYEPLRSDECWWDGDPFLSKYDYEPF